MIEQALREAARFIGTDGAMLEWDADELAAILSAHADDISRDRNPKGQDPQGLGAKHESAKSSTNQRMDPMNNTTPQVTDAMIEAGYGALLDCFGDIGGPDQRIQAVRNIYRAMSQAHPTDEEAVDFGALLDAKAKELRERISDDDYRGGLIRADVVFAALNAIRGGE